MAAGITSSPFQSQSSKLHFYKEGSHFDSNGRNSKNEAFQIIPNRPENACGKTRQSFQSTAVIVEASVRCSLSGMRRTSKSHNHHQNPTCPRIYVLFTCCLYSRNEIPCPVNIINTYIIYESVYNYYILLQYITVQIKIMLRKKRCIYTIMEYHGMPVSYPFPSTFLPAPSPMFLPCH